MTDVTTSMIRNLCIGESRMDWKHKADFAEFDCTRRTLRRGESGLLKYFLAICFQTENVPFRPASRFRAMLILHLRFITKREQADCTSALKHVMKKTEM